MRRGRLNVDDLRHGESKLFRLLVAGINVSARPSNIRARSRAARTNVFMSSFRKITTSSVCREAWRATRRDGPAVSNRPDNNRRRNYEQPAQTVPLNESPPSPHSNRSSGLRTWVLPAVVSGIRSLA